MRIELEVACRLARYCCDVMNSSHGGIPLQTRNRLSLKMAVAAPIANTQGQHKFLLRLSCWPPFEPRNPAEVDRSQRLPVSPLWVKSIQHKGSAECPLYPRKRTSDLCIRPCGADVCRSRPSRIGPFRFITGRLPRTQHRASRGSP